MLKWLTVDLLQLILLLVSPSTDCVQFKLYCGHYNAPGGNCRYVGVSPLDTLEEELVICHWWSLRMWTRETMRGSETQNQRAGMDHGGMRTIRGWLVAGPVYHAHYSTVSVCLDIHRCHDTCNVMLDNKCIIQQLSRQT